MVLMKSVIHVLGVTSLTFSSLRSMPFCGSTKPMNVIYIKYTFLLIKGKAPVIHSGSALSPVACHVQLCKDHSRDHRWWCHLKCLPFHCDMSALVEWPANISLEQRWCQTCYERFHATWHELDLMVAPLQIRFTEDVASSHVFDYFINCGNRVSLTNDCFVDTNNFFVLRFNTQLIWRLFSCNHKAWPTTFTIESMIICVMFKLENTLCMFSLAGYWTSLAKWTFRPRL